MVRSVGGMARSGSGEGRKGYKTEGEGEGYIAKLGGDMGMEGTDAAEGDGMFLGLGCNGVLRGEDKYTVWCIYNVPGMCPLVECTYCSQG